MHDFSGIGCYVIYCVCYDYTSIVIYVIVCMIGEIFYPLFRILLKIEMLLYA